MKPVSRLLNCALGALLLPFSLCAQGLTIARAEPWPSPEEPVYLRLTIKGAAVQAGCEIAIDGALAAFEELPGASEDERDYIVYVGAPGEKRILATARTPQGWAQASAVYRFSSNGGLLLLDHYDREAIADGEELNVLAYFASDVQIAVNGQPVRAEAMERSESKGHSIYACPLWLRPGANRVEYSATGLDGRRIVKSFLAYRFDKDTAHVGDRFRYAIGPGKRRAEDPELALRILGDALAAEGPAEEVTLFVALESPIYSPMPILAQPIVARRTGWAALELSALGPEGERTTETQSIEVLP